MPEESYLSRIHSPEDLRELHKNELPALCEELRETLIRTVSQTGGHLSSNLGVVELTVALHRVFSLPHDCIVWDVGHQCYVHKLLTGRAERFDTLRTEGGVSGFPRPCESDYDSFVTGHSSTSISAANGIAKAKALAGDDGYVVAVIGDGALTGGLAYEGLSNAGRSTDRLIVVLNDNRMSISRNVGFVARHLAHLRSRTRYVRFKSGFGRVLNHVPLIGKPLNRLLLSAKSSLKTTIYRQSSLFEEMGFYYLGPVDGHDLDDLTRALKTAKSIGRPVVVHAVTVKGQGYSYAMNSPDRFHGVSRFDVVTGTTPEVVPTFSSTFGQALCALAEQDERVCAITAAMKSGTCLQEFSARFPDRFFDVGIAEEHAVTFASGLAKGGRIPVFAVYSTFLQRSYDQLLNDTAILGSHIVLAVDRAGIVPDDGETHQGIFDVPFLTTIPNTTIYAPASFAELQLHLQKALFETSGIAVVRYPKGEELTGAQMVPVKDKPYTLLKGEGADTLLVTYGRIFANVIRAAQTLVEEGRPVSILKLNRIHPLDPGCVAAAKGYRRVLFFEEGSACGGIGEHFGTQLMAMRYTGEYRHHAVEPFVTTCKTDAGLRNAGLDVDGILRAVRPEA